MYGGFLCQVPPFVGVSFPVLFRSPRSSSSRGSRRDPLHVSHLDWIQVCWCENVSGVMPGSRSPLFLNYGRLAVAQLLLLASAFRL